MEIKSILNFTKPYNKYKLMSLLFLVLSGISNILVYIWIANIISYLFLNSSIGINFIIYNSAFVLLFYSMKVLFNISGLYFSHILAYNSLANIRTAIVNKIAKLSLGKIAEKKFGEYKKIIADNVDDLEVYLAHMMPEGIADIVTIIISFISLFIIDYRMAFAILLIIPLGFFALFIMFKIGMKNIKNYYNASTNVNNNIIEYFNGMAVIKVFSATDKAYNRYSDAIKNLTKETLQWVKSTSAYVQIYQVIFSTTIFFALPLGIYLYEYIGIYTLVLSLMIALGLVNPLLNLMKFMPVLGTLNEKGKDILKLVNEEELKLSKNNSDIISKDIKINNLSFKYNTENVLKNINLEFKEGSFNAIVGKSGSGKSTLIKLLMRMWDYSDGEILIGDKNIQDIQFEELMTLITYVSQDNFLFNMSIKDNIKIGNPNASDEEVIEVAKMSKCHDFIMSLSNAYDTVFSSAGTNLSGGEKQRITIARAMIKKSPIILLDEATSSIDPENEIEIQSALQKLVKDKTLIVIAHKLSTIVDADNIIVLDNGEVVAIDTHTNLLKYSAQYKKLWNSSDAKVNWNIN